jgi:WD40 repeat protein
MHLLRGDLDWIVMKALEKDRSRRYEAVNGLALDVQRHIENKPVMAGPPGRAYRFRKFVRRNRFAFATGGVVMASLIVGLVLFIWQWHRAEQANDQLAIALSEMHLERIRTGGPSRLTRTESTLKGSETYLAWPGKRRELRVSNVNQAQVYDTATDIPITPQLEITGPIRSAGFSPDESKLFILGDEPEVNLWDANVGHLLTRPLLHDGRVTFAEFSPDGKRFLTLSEARPAHDATQRTVVAMVWDVHSGTALTPGLKNDEVSLIDARFTDDGKHFVTISEQGSVAVWDSRTGKRKSIHTSSHFHIRFQTPGVSGRIRG